MLLLFVRNMYVCNELFSNVCQSICIIQSNCCKLCDVLSNYYNNIEYVAFMMGVSLPTYMYDNADSMYEY